MLGLAASHLTLCSSTDYSSQALTHRVKAINSLNRSLNKPCLSKAEGDARFATVMALTFQSSYMQEGMMEFISMVRGCIVVSDTAMLDFEESAFRSFSPEQHEKTVRGLKGSAVSDIGYAVELDMAIASVRRVRPLCYSILEVKYLGMMEGMLKTAKTSQIGGTYFDRRQSNIADTVYQLSRTYQQPTTCWAKPITTNSSSLLTLRTTPRRLS